MQIKFPIRNVMSRKSRTQEKSINPTLNNHEPDNNPSFPENPESNPARIKPKSKTRTMISFDPRARALETSRLASYLKQEPICR